MKGIFLLLVLAFTCSIEGRSTTWLLTELELSSGIILSGSYTLDSSSGSFVSVDLLVSDGRSLRFNNIPPSQSYLNEKMIVLTSNHVDCVLFFGIEQINEEESMIKVKFCEDSSCEESYSRSGVSNSNYMSIRRDSQSSVISRANAGNTNCAGAVKASLGNNNWSNIDAVYDPSKNDLIHCEIGSSVWYVLPVPQGPNVAAVNITSFTPKDSVVGLYYGESCSSLVYLGCNDDTYGYLSYIRQSFNATVNMSIYIEVGGYKNIATGNGTFDLQLSSTVPITSSALTTGRVPAVTTSRIPPSPPAPSLSTTGIPLFTSSQVSAPPNTPSPGTVTTGGRVITTGSKQQTDFNQQPVPRASSKSSLTVAGKVMIGVAVPLIAIGMIVAWSLYRSYKHEKKAEDEEIEMDRL